LHLNTQALGYDYYKICVYTQDFTLSIEKAILSWCETNPHLIYYIRKIAPWTFELEFETPDFKIVNKTLKDLRNTFGSLIKRIEITNIEQEVKGELSFL
jgi:hypothetical protein